MQSPAALLFERLSMLGRTVATAESCSGGLIAHRLTNVAGVSACFMGGVVAYSNEAKVNILNVDRADIDRLGAVSEPVARQLAESVRTRFNAHYGIGVTGIAGPGGGSPEKPVGLVYIGVAGPPEEGPARVERHVFMGGRDAVKDQTADTALRMLLAYIDSTPL